MAIVNVSQQNDREFVEDHEEVVLKLRKFAIRKTKYEAQVATDTANVAEVGARVRRGLVRYKPALDDTLENPVTDIEIERDAQGEIVKIHTNADAVAFRQ
jgi:hypothetical protein